MHLRRGGDQHQLTHALRLCGGERQGDRAAERMRYEDERLHNLQVVEGLGEVPEELLQRVGRARLLRASMAAKIGRDDAMLPAEMSDLILPLLGLPARAVDAHDRPVPRR